MKIVDPAFMTKNKYFEVMGQLSMYLAEKDELHLSSAFTSCGTIAVLGFVMLNIMCAGGSKCLTYICLDRRSIDKFPGQCNCAGRYYFVPQVEKENS